MTHLCWQVCNSKFRALIDAFTPTTYIMVVSSSSTALPTGMCVTWLIPMCDVTFICMTWHVHVCGMIHSYVRSHIYHGRFRWLIRMCDVTHSYVRHDSFICVTRLICMRDIACIMVVFSSSTALPTGMCVTWFTTHTCVSHHPFVSVMWLICTCDVTHSYVWCDLLLVSSSSTALPTGICETMCDMTRSYVWRDAFVHATWLTHMCDVTRSYLWRDSFVCVICLMHICDVLHAYVWRDSFMCAMTHSCVCHHLHDPRWFNVWHDPCVRW